MKIYVGNKPCIRACIGDKEIILDNIIKANSISITPESIAIDVGKTIQLEALILPENATNKKIIWESSNSGFATVSEVGVVTAIHKGELMIKGTLSDNVNIYDTVNLTITDTIEEDNDDIISNYTGIYIANEIQYLEVGDEIGIIAMCMPYDLHRQNEFILTSNDSTIVSVIEPNIIKGIGQGEVTITSRTTDKAYSDSVKVKVIAKPLEIYNKVYNLDFSRFNIIPDNSSEQICIGNSLGINSALKYCKKYGYDKIIFPQNQVIYIEAMNTIYMESNLTIDLNNSELKIRPNDYERYSAIYFGINNINLFKEYNCSSPYENTIYLGVRNTLKVMSSQNLEYYINKISVVKPKLESEFNQVLDYFNYGDNLNVSFLVAKNVVKIDNSLTSSCNLSFYIEYFKDNNLVYEGKISSNAWVASNTAQYFSSNTFKLSLRNVEDYNSIRFKFKWSITNSNCDLYTGSFVIKKEVTSVLENCKLCNGIITGERDEKEKYYPNWTSNGNTEGGCSIIFNEGYNNGIENLIVRKSVGFNMASNIGYDAYGARRCNKGILYNKLEIGGLDFQGNLEEDANRIRYKDFIDISNIKDEICFGYPLGYMGFDIMRARFIDYYFYDINYNLICVKKCKCSYRNYKKPVGAFYCKLVLHWNQLPSQGNTDFGGAIGFLDEPKSPTKNYIRNCIIEDNYSTGLALCGGYNWQIQGNTFRRNGGRMPGCDIDWEDGWEYMQDDVIRNNAFESSTSLILCAGNNYVIKGNSAKVNTVWGRTRNYKFINNICTEGQSFGCQETSYSFGNSFNGGTVGCSTQHSNTNYYVDFQKNIFNNVNIAVKNPIFRKNAISGRIGSANIDEAVINNIEIYGVSNITNSTIIGNIRAYGNSAKIDFANSIFNNAIVYEMDNPYVNIHNCLFNNIDKILIQCKNITIENSNINIISSKNPLIYFYNVTSLGNILFYNCSINLPIDYNINLLKIDWGADSPSKALTVIFDKTTIIPEGLKCSSNKPNVAVIYK